MKYKKKTHQNKKENSKLNPSLEYKENAAISSENYDDYFLKEDITKSRLIYYALSLLFYYLNSLAFL